MPLQQYTSGMWCHVSHGLAKFILMKMGSWQVAWCDVLYIVIMEVVQNIWTRYLHKLIDFHYTSQTHKLISYLTKCLQVSVMHNNDNVVPYNILYWLALQYNLLWAPNVLCISYMYIPHFPWGSTLCKSLIACAFTQW